MSLEDSAVNKTGLSQSHHVAYSPKGERDRNEENKLMAKTITDCGEFCEGW